MKRLYLKNVRRYALVDDEDYEIASRHKWRGRACPDRDAIYVVCGSGSDYRCLHWLVTGIKGIDHINGNPLDNRKGNLRPATTTQNGQNRKPNTNKKSSRFKGVSKARGIWRSEITVNGRLVYLGAFKTQKLAARAYDRAAIKHFGEYARPNFKEAI